ncbi:hypothetical protein [Streptomyces sp. CBMA152]|uniref:hypothetical protein n=1 Tax=Streptomyces sp. CBMA152 TaxID=1896312 RepID=UPI00166039C5|nr:hypothetical protein [Streptomyces sp. CBMA152]MBD0744951.1 hypothetical protein [Streptomyces sp. CBMA152]
MSAHRRPELPGRLPGGTTVGLVLIVGNALGLTGYAATINHDINRPSTASEDPASASVAEQPDGGPRTCRCGSRPP